MSLRLPWRGLFGRKASSAGENGRWIVLDVESSGLDPDRDRLIALAAVAVRWDRRRARVAPTIDLGDSFETVLHHPDGDVDKPNILVHGVGVGEQHAGVEPRTALETFEAWAAGSPLLAFHAPFDQRLLERAAKACLGRQLANPWLDLAPLAGVLWPDLKARSLDDWLAHFGLRCIARHRAAADALVAAELLLRLWPALVAQVGARPDFAALQRLAAQRRWLPH